MQHLRYVRFVREHIPACVKLKNHVGWNQVADDWELLIELTGNGSFVALRDQIPVGTVTVAEYLAGEDEHIGWIGMVLVHPEYRRRGIATELVSRAIEASGHLDYIGLDATAAGSPLYKKLGFKKVSTITRWERIPRPVLPKGELIQSNDGNYHANPMTADLVDESVRLDRDASGIDRSRLLRSFYVRNPSVSSVVFDSGGIGGFAVGREGSNATQIGPLIARSAEILEPLLSDVVSRHEVSRHAPKLYIDVPDSLVYAQATLKSFGFCRSRTFTRMMLNRPRAANGFAEEKTPCPIRDTVAIAGPEFG